MRQEAVALSYLEWIRLINTGAIRLDEKRVVRWNPDKTKPANVVAELMLSAPDLGTSATSFVLALLKPEALDRIRQDGFYLGPRLPLETVCSFHSFSDAALAVHRHDAEAVGVLIDLTSLGAGWGPWAAAVQEASSRAQGEMLLTLLNVSPCDRFDQAEARIADLEQCIAADDIARSRDSMFYGWACVLNAHKVRTGAVPSLPNEVKDEIAILRKDFDVDQPFLARAPRLLEFVVSLDVETDRPTDLLAMASLKQHERYAIKREGTALGLPSLFDDIRVLEALHTSAAGLLVQALGARLPAELIRALKAVGISRAVAPSGLPNAAGEDATSAPDAIRSAEVDRSSDLYLSPKLEGDTSAPDFVMLQEAMTEKSISGSGGSETCLVSEESGSACGQSEDEMPQNVEVPSNLANRSQVPQSSGQLGLDLDPTSTEPEEIVIASFTDHVDGKKANLVAKPKSKPRTAAPKRRTSRKNKDQNNQ